MPQQNVGRMFSTNHINFISNQVGAHRALAESATEDNASLIEEMEMMVEKLKAHGMDATSAEARLEAVRHMHDTTLAESKER